MAKDDQLEDLRANHAKLKEQITDEYARPNPDDTRIHELKIQKLNIKDQIADLERT